MASLLSFQVALVPLTAEWSTLTPLSKSELVVSGKLSQHLTTHVLTKCSLQLSSVRTQRTPSVTKPGEVWMGFGLQICLLSGALS